MERLEVLLEAANKDNADLRRQVAEISEVKNGLIAAMERRAVFAEQQASSIRMCTRCGSEYISDGGTCPVCDHMTKLDAATADRDRLAERVTTLEAAARKVVHSMHAHYSGAWPAALKDWTDTLNAALTPAPYFDDGRAIDGTEYWQAGTESETK